MRLVSNSGPILSFARANRFDVLNAVVQELFIPEAVYDDIVVAGHDKVGAREVADAVWIRRTRMTDTSSADRLSSPCRGFVRRSKDLGTPQTPNIRTIDHLTLRNWFVIVAPRLSP